MLTLVNAVHTVDARSVKKKKNVTPSKGLERRYGDSLEAVAMEIEKIIKTYFTRFTPYAATKTIEALGRYSSKLFDWAKWTSSVIVYAANDDSKKRWKEISKRMSYELKKQIENTPIGDMLQQYLDDNVKFITSMPLNAAKKVHDLFLTEQLLAGTRATTLEEEIMKIGNVTRNRAKLIARTETSRITTGLTMARAKSIGSDWYIWRSSEDARVRSSHKVMEGVLVNWNNPPSPELLVGKKPYGTYHAGSTYNCRCFPEPVVDANDVQFPAKIYMNGMVTRVSKSNFLSVSGEVIEANKYIH